MLHHYVFLKYRTDTAAGHIDSFCERMLALRHSISEIQHLEIGRDELHDSRSWDLLLVMRFRTAADLRAYQKHPDHLAVAAFNDPFVADVGSVDFVANG